MQTTHKEADRTIYFQQSELHEDVLELFLKPHQLEDVSD